MSGSSVDLQPYAMPAVSVDGSGSAEVVIVLASEVQLRRLREQGVMALHSGRAQPVLTAAEQAEIIRAWHEKSKHDEDGGVSH